MAQAQTAQKKSNSSSPRSRKSTKKVYDNSELGRAERFVDEAEAAGFSAKQLDIIIKLAKMANGTYHV